MWIYWKETNLNNYIMIVFMRLLYQLTQKEVLWECDK
jgi:hypothetical protein